MNAIPNHIAVVPNGNRRGSNLKAVPLGQAYILGALRALEIASLAKQVGVKHISFYGLSVENMERRPEEQIDALTQGAIKFLDEAGTIGHVHTFGEIERFEGVEKYEPLFSRLKCLNHTDEKADYTIHVAAHYSGRAKHELPPYERALYTRGFPEVHKDTTYERYLLSGGVPEVDLFIRTGGEHRTSGFLPFQIAYAELYFTRVLWGDFDDQEFATALDWYAGQQRNFGK